MKVPALLSAAALLVAVSVPLAISAPPPAAPAAPSAPAAPAEGKVFAPTDLEGMRAAINETITVEGTVTAAAENKTKTARYLNFTPNFKESVSLVFFVSKGGDDFAMEKLSPWAGKKIRVSGKVTDHNGALQIAIDRLDQIQEIQ